MFKLKETIIIDNQKHVLQLWELVEGKPTILMLDDAVFLRANRQVDTNIEQTPVFHEQILQKVEQKPMEMKPEVKIEPVVKIAETKKERKAGTHDRLISTSDELAQEGSTKIYGHILNFIMDRVSDRFTVKDVSVLMRKVYDDVLERKISNASCDVYARTYVRYMEKNGFVLPHNDGMFTKNLEGLVHRLAHQKSWHTQTFDKGISISTIQKFFPDRSEEEIKNALTRLIVTKQVTQLSSDRVRFN